MKKCPYCAEDIQDAAIKCRYCDSLLSESAGGAPNYIEEARALLMGGDRDCRHRSCQETHRSGPSGGQDVR